MPLLRTLPPAASPLYFADIFNGIKGIFGGSKEIDGLLSEISHYFNQNYCFAFCSGTAALSYLLTTLREKEPTRNQVIVPAFTCYSVYAAIKRAGLIARPCDINPYTLDYDYKKLKSIIESNYHSQKQNASSHHYSKILAILCVHLFGLASNLSNIRSLLPHDISLIEDAAQAFGCSNHVGKLGTLGKAGIFSLGRGKQINSLNGGVLVTSDDHLGYHIQQKIEDLDEAPKSLQIKKAAISFIFSFLQHPILFGLPRALPFLRLGETIYDTSFPIHRFTPYQAGLLRNWRSKLSYSQQIRSQNSAWWNNNINMKLIQKIEIPEHNNGFPPLLRYPLLAQDAILRDRITSISEKKGLGIMPGYPGTIKDIKDIELVNNMELYPGAEMCVDQLFTLPVHQWIRKQERIHIMNILQSV